MKFHRRARAGALRSAKRCQFPPRRKFTEKKGEEKPERRRNRAKLRPAIWPLSLPREALDRSVPDPLSLGFAAWSVRDGAPPSCGGPREPPFEPARGAQARSLSV